MLRAVCATVAAVFTLVAAPAAAQPDLEMSWWNITPTSVQGAGSQVTINYFLSNTGDTDSGAFYIGFYYGDSTSTAGLTYLGHVAIGSLSGYGGGAGYTTTVTMPTSSLTGSRYLHYFIDHDAKVTESDETNNQGYTPITVTGKPDLQVSLLTASPTSVAPGGTLTVTYRVYNAGPSRAPGPLYLRFYHSINSSIATSDTYLNQEIAITTVLAQSSYPTSVNGSTPVTLPSSVGVGASYIGAIVDHNDVVDESAENNNTKATPITVVAGQPDLVMKAWSSTPAAVPGSGSTVQISFEIENSGAGAAGASTVRFAYGDSATPTGLTTLATRSVAALASGASSGTLSESVTMPPEVLHGTRYLHYFLDDSAQVAESDETNNQGTRTVGITGQPDLQLSSLSVSPTSASPGGSLTVSYRIHNSGPSRAPATFYTRFYYSPDAAISTADAYLNQQVSVASLLAGAYYPASADGTAPITVPVGAQPGTRYIGGISDFSAMVTEANEANNTAAAPIVVISGAGTPCTQASQCATGFCVDGVCCNSACGGGAADCQACSTAAGGPVDGTCSPLPGTAVCRAAAGICDVAETCTGSSATCPADVLEPTSTVCRAAAGICDVAEACTGTSAACPTDQLQPTGTVCRAASGECDLAELCAGTAACPADLYKPNGAPCSVGLCSGGSCLPTPDSGPPDLGPDGGVDLGPEAGLDAALEAGSDGPAGDATGVDGPAGDGPEMDGLFGDGPTPIADASLLEDDLGPAEAGFDGPIYNPPHTEEGCSCALGAAPRPEMTLLGLLALLLLGLLRRRG